MRSISEPFLPEERWKSRQLVRITYKFNERDILVNAGNVNKTLADQLVLEQYGISHRHRLTEEAQRESFTDDIELKVK